MLSVARWVTESISCSTYRGLLELMVVNQWLYDSSRVLSAQTRNPGKLFNFANNIKHIGIYHYWQKSKQLLSKDQGKCHLKQLQCRSIYSCCFTEHVFICQQPKCESPFHYLLYSFSCRKIVTTHLTWRLQYKIDWMFLAHTCNAHSSTVGMHIYVHIQENITKYSKMCTNCSHNSAN